MYFWFNENPVRMSNGEKFEQITEMANKTTTTRFSISLFTTILSVLATKLLFMLKSRIFIIENVPLGQKQK
jgi:hypothetical protein